MSPLPEEWPSWFSYEWWRDLAIPLAGLWFSLALGLLSLLVSSVVGVAALLIAQRSHLLAEKVQRAETERLNEENRREGERQRLDFAALARQFNLMLRRSKVNEPLPVEEMDLEMYEDYLKSVAATLNDPSSAEYLIRRMSDLFSPVRFPPEEDPVGDDLPTDERRRDAWMNWRVADLDVRAYSRGKPMSTPHPFEQRPKGWSSYDAVAQVKTQAAPRLEAQARENSKNRDAE